MMYHMVCNAFFSYAVLLILYPSFLYIYIIYIYKGVLFHGPPGTGKTTLVNKLCSKMDVEMVCDPLASSDFNRPYKGDSERMVDDIARRAGIVKYTRNYTTISNIK